MKRLTFTIVSAMLMAIFSYGQTKLTGTVVGTPDNLAGVGETVATIFDGDFATGFDTGPTAKNDAWAGLDFGEGVQKNLDSIRFSIRIPGNLANIGLMKERLAGTKIYGANTLTVADPEANGMEADTTDNLLYVIPLSAFDTVTIEEWVNVKLLQNTEKSFRYILLFFDASSFGNISEFEVYGSEATVTAISTQRAPKPFNAFLSHEGLMIKSDKKVQASVEVYSMNGRLVAKQTQALNSGINQIKLSTTLDDNTLYVLRMKAGNEVYSQKILK